SIDDFDAVGALTAAAVPIVCSLMHAAASRGEALDGFVMDFVYPATKGPSIRGKRVILVDAWLSEKSYVQTSSLVTLRNGNELSLDFGIVDAQGATVVAIASLIGGVDIEEPTVRVIDPVDDTATDVPFIETFHESELH
ncbi:MAG: orotate phosphoribosyltransferase, partial [Bifidobacterium criceti]|nr:orotate phosphoribosyltransferase [Bifidobacterium criceti]